MVHPSWFLSQLTAFLSVRLSAYLKYGFFFFKYNFGYRSFCPETKRPRIYRVIYLTNLILFAFTENLSADNYKLSAESGLPGLSLLGSMGVCWGCFWAYFGVFWGILWGCFWTYLVVFWAYLGLFWGVFGHIWGTFGVLLATFGAHLGHIFGVFWGVLGCFFGHNLVYFLGCCGRI